MTSVSRNTESLQPGLALLLDAFDRNHAPSSFIGHDSPEHSDYLDNRDLLASGLCYDEADGPGLEVDCEEEWIYELAAAYHRWSYPSLATREVKARQKRAAFDAVADRIDAGTYPPTYAAAESWKADGWDAEIVAWALDTYRQARPEFGPGPDLDAEVDALVAKFFGLAQSPALSA